MRFTARWRCQSATSRASIRPNRMIPAQLTARSSRPWRSTTVPTAAGDRRGVGDIRAQHTISVAGQVETDDGRPLRGQRRGGGRPDPGRCPRDQGDLALEARHRRQGVGQVVGQVAHLVHVEAALGEAPGPIGQLEAVAVAAGDDRLERQVRSGLEHHVAGAGGGRLPAVVELDHRVR